MAMGRRKKGVRQEGLWIPTAVLPVGASHPFYQRLNQILDEKKFDEYVEAICEQFYADEVGRPGMAPGIYFRLLMVGYSKGSIRSAASRGAPATAYRSDRSCESHWMKVCRTTRPSHEPGG
jgi:transposase